MNCCIYIPHQLDKNYCLACKSEKSILIYIPHQLDKNPAFLPSDGLQV